MNKFDFAFQDDFLNAWIIFEAKTHLGPIESEEDYERSNQLLTYLLAELGDKEEDLTPREASLARLLDIVSDYISDYEDKHYRLPDAEPREVLAFLIEQNDLRQSDLADIFKTQSVVSEVLKGKRDITGPQARALADRFHVSSDIFLKPVETSIVT